MREIKFRAWDSATKEMYAHETLCEPSGDGSRLLYKEFIAFRESGVVPMQFTGLLDNNELPIYEGDVVKCDRYAGTPCKFVRHIGKVEYQPHGGFRIAGVKQYEGVSAELNSWPREVIGNIYENPELYGSQMVVTELSNPIRTDTDN